MSSQYIVAWSGRGLEGVLNLTAHSRQHMIDILMENALAKYTSNPIRDMIVDATIRGLHDYEIWQVESELSDAEIQTAFENSPTEFKDEIIEVGELLFTSYMVIK